MASIIQIRRDTASAWTSANPTLAQGELALETDTLKLKAGDGTTSWTSLAYYDLGTAGYLASTGGALTGAITTNSTFDGRNVSVDGTKLDGIATNANNYTLPAGIATETYVGTQVSNLVDSSPAALNTLNELAAALGDDANFSTTITNSIATKLPLSGGTVTGLVNMSDQIVQRPLLQDYSEKTVAMGSATAVNLEDGNVFSKTISGTTTLTFTNPSSVGTSSFSLILTNGGSATLNFPTVKWPAATAPTLTASGIDVLIFVYHGSTWYGIASGIGMA